MDALDARTTPTGPGDEMSGDRDGAHDDIAQRSEYESIGGGSITADYNPASVWTARALAPGRSHSTPGAPARLKPSPPADMLVCRTLPLTKTLLGPCWLIRGALALSWRGASVSMARARFRTDRACRAGMPGMGGTHGGAGVRGRTAGRERGDARRGWCAGTHGGARRGSVGGFGPASAGADGDLQGDPERGRARHGVLDQGFDGVQLARGDLDHQLVMDLQDHPRP